jgi:exopolysaccharide biosynthesis polyprenyl glycosylphosphotransferase
VLTVVLLLVDSLALGVAFWLAYYVRFEALPYFAPYTARDYAMLITGIIPAWLLIFAVFQLYNPRFLFGGTEEYARAFNAVSLGTVGLVVFGFLQRDGFAISRGWLALSWFLAFFLASLARFSLRRVVYALRQRGHLLSPAIIVGANQEGLALAEQLQGWASSGLNLVGFVDNSEPLESPILDHYPVLGRLDDLEDLVKEKNVEELIIAPTALRREQLLDLFQEFGTNSQANLRLSSGLFEIMTTGLQVKELAYVPLISLSKARITGLDAVLKAILDYGLTTLLLVLLSPLLGLVALAIRIDSPGPVFHRRRVMGVGGGEFDALKFRTMHVHGDEILAAHGELKAQLENDHKLKDDPRVTQLGKFLRRWSLDELPQLINVLRGEMSLVGPRMISPPEMAEYGKWGMNLLTVKPGMTGLWQVGGRSDLSYEERVRMDMHYIRNWSIWLDLQLLMRTIPAVLRAKGAY